MKSWYETEEEGDEFGPGSDLILSMLAVAILVIGMSGVLTTAPTPLSREELTEILQGDDQAEPEAVHEEVAAQQVNQVPVPEIQPYNVVDTEDAPLFEIDSAELTAKAKGKLRDYVAQKIALLRASNVNVLRIAGHASPEPRSSADGRDTNLDLSARRAISVVHFYASQGVSYQCMSVEAFGRTRSTVLKLFLNGGDRRSVDGWDKIFRSADGRRFTRDLNELVYEDRRISLAPSFDPESQCSHEMLMEGLAKVLQR